MPVLRETTNEERLRPCANVYKCAGEIKLDEPCFYDESSVSTAPPRVYCSPCGKMLRYHRKKAAERGDSLPMTFEDVDRILGR